MASKYVVLTYHRVRPHRDELIPGMCDVARFASQLAVMKRWFNVLPLSEAIERSSAGTLPPRTVCITFDDGYRDNVDIALPMLVDAGLHATFFIATGYLNDGIMWNDQVIHAVRHRGEGAWDLDDIGLGPRQITDMASRRALFDEIITHLKHREPGDRAAAARRLYQASEGPRERLMMTDEELVTLHRAGMAIGGHTVTHPILTRLSADAARDELSDGRARLQSLTGDAVPLFAYPNGKADQDYDASHAALARELGFDAALSTVWGHADAASPRYELPRVGLEWESGWRFGVKLYRCFYEAQGQRARALPAAA
ncbi:MAG: polysaccharide deacetylase family protein [Pseudomonadota bacterium]